MFKFLHAADIHLDSPLVGLERYDGAPIEEIRGATRKALENLVDLAISEEVAFLLIAGDLYDGDWPDYNTGLFFAAQMAKLEKAGIRVFVISGNHDAASQITRQLRLPDNISVFSTKKPETTRLDDLQVAIHGQGFPTQAVTENLALAYPEPVRGFFNIGLLHTSADGYAGHERYAPCKVRDLVSKDYDYWALGHVHRRDELCTKPWVLFPGNLQGRRISEAGPKGATLVIVENGAVLTVKHRELDAVRWEVCEIDASSAETTDDVLDSAREVIASAASCAGDRVLAARVRLVGRSPVHAELTKNHERWVSEIRSVALAAGGRTWIESLQICTKTSIDLESLRVRDDALGELLRATRDLRGDHVKLRTLSEEFRDLMSFLPSEYADLDDALNLGDPSALGNLIDEVEQILIPRLLEGGQQS